MTETVRGNKASVLRSRIPRFRDNRSQLTSLPPLPKDRQRKSEAETVSEIRARSSSCTPWRTCPTFTLQARQNWMQALEADQKNLEIIQNTFMNKIRKFAEQGRKLPGTYKFVVMVCNDNRELVKDSSVDSVAKNNEKLIIDKLAQRDETISELQRKLLLSEELTSKLVLELAESQKKDSSRQRLEAEALFAKTKFYQIYSYLQETDIKLKDATERVNKNTDKVIDIMELLNQVKANVDKELASLLEQHQANHDLLAARSKTIIKLQQSELKFKEQYGNLFQELSQKNTQMNLLNNELDAKNDQLDQVLKALKEKLDAVAKQQNTIRLLEEQALRTSLVRTKHEERMASMQVEIAQLKQCLSNHAHVMVANIQGMEAVRAQQYPLPQPEL
ncbi:uncharacterized protein salto isoform X1 [Drosophila kikkawai]|uniref:Uncharacterized protein salto isoform X1 n=1 Tax=Drosophila kikkawai TaxID=30033 RepID=A0A6P4JF43_DROKI|nr:myosin-J heavy chain-like isoform X1 [Drosophila kikkawai]